MQKSLLLLALALALPNLAHADEADAHYRAGLAFLDAEADAVTAFTSRHRRQP